MSLTVEQLKEKIAVVEADMSKLQTEQGNDRKISAISDYISYLKDELKLLEQTGRPKND